MRFDVITLFPSMFDACLQESILGRAIKEKLLEVYLHNLREFCLDKHKTADDYPYGGGGGMILKAEPIKKAIEKINTKKAKVILLTPQGEAFNQKKAEEFVKEEHLVLVCGHYEEVDERVKNFIEEEISVGDFVLTGGELPAMIIIDAVARLIPKVLGDDQGWKKETFVEGLLDYPQFTRPAKIDDNEVPRVLLSGDHRAVLRWRRKKSLEKTFYHRPDLLSQAFLSPEDKDQLKEIIFARGAQILKNTAEEHE